MNLQTLKDLGLAPEFLTEEGYSTLKNGYLLENENPIDMYKRVAKAAAANYPKEIESKFFDYMWKGWLCPATPVAANMGTERALPISCFSSYVPDNLGDIFDTVKETALMSKYGGGTSIHLKDVRPAGNKISKGGNSSGVVSWLKVFDSMIASTNQGGTRRGALASYLPIEHKDIKEFLKVRRPEGDPNRWCPNVHHGINISNSWMNDLISGDTKKRELWSEVLKSRFETGEPYLFFTDHAQKGNPKHLPWYEVKGSNLCLHPLTKVLTKEFGGVFIKDLVGLEVTIFDGYNWVKNNSFRMTQAYSEFYEVEFNNQDIVVCTPNHRWPVIGVGLVPTTELKEYSLISVMVGEHVATVTGVKKSLLTGPAFCTTVESSSQFALANGIMTGNCSEIFLNTDKDHSLVCCLSSLNLTKYDEWKNTDLVKIAIYFLDGVMEEFIKKAKTIPGLERACNFATKSRALGLGVLGWHSLLQSKKLPFDSFHSMMLNAEIFSKLDKESLEASKELAQLLGEPEWMLGTGLRNTHRLAIAPTVSNSTISGNVSAGIEPLAANVYVKKSAKGTFIQYNPILRAALEELKLNTDEVWNKIIKQEGSVFGIKEIPEEVQQVFLTAREINQFAIIKQAGQRQKFIDQGQSINLFFASNSDPKYINSVHLEAWKEELKSLYYLRSSSPIRADLASRGADECVACEG
jgi:ribonucleotide reductase alpha subunit